MRVLGMTSLDLKLYVTGPWCARHPEEHSDEGAHVSRLIVSSSHRLTCLIVSPSHLSHLSHRLIVSSSQPYHLSQLQRHHRPQHRSGDHIAEVVCVDDHAGDGNRDAEGPEEPAEFGPCG